MRRRQLSIILVAALLITAVTVVGIQSAPSSATADETATPHYRVKAKNARLNREVTGPVTAQVQGVPAEPVHSFVWDGVGSEPIKGSIDIDIDPVANSGTIHAKWTDRNGRWELTQTAFAAPPHSTGLRVGPSASSTVLIHDDPVTTDVYLHGDTTAGGPVLPTLFNYLATWGPAEVKLNGQPFENPFDGPAPLWVTHTMTTVGVRNSDGQVTANNGDIFNPTMAGQGDTDETDREVHLVFHDAPGPETSNFPPPLSFFYHLQFEDVDIRIREAD